MRDFTTSPIETMPTSCAVDDDGDVADPPLGHQLGELVDRLVAARPSRRSRS